MSTQHNTPSAREGQQPNSNPTRREFLTNLLAAVPVATVAALSATASLEISRDGESCEVPTETAPPTDPTVLAPLNRFTDCLIELSNFQAAIFQVGANWPNEVDAVQLARLHNEAMDTVAKLKDVVWSLDFEKALAELVGGREVLTAAYQAIGAVEVS